MNIFSCSASFDVTHRISASGAHARWDPVIQSFDTSFVATHRHGRPKCWEISRLPTVFRKEQGSSVNFQAEKLCGSGQRTKVWIDV